LGNKPRILIDRPTQVSFCDALGEAWSSGKDTSGKYRCRGPNTSLNVLLIAVGVVLQGYHTCVRQTLLDRILSWHHFCGWTTNPQTHKEAPTATDIPI
jgi:hypothetical protein